MKKKGMLLIAITLAVFSVVFFGKTTEATSEEIVTQTKQTEVIDFSSSIEKKMTRSGSQEIIIDGDKWDKSVKDAYKKKFPNYKGEVRITDINASDDSEEITFEESMGINESPTNRARVSAPVNGSPNSSVGKVQAYFFLGDGKVKHFSGTAFKIANNRFATAAHVLYDKNLGWASSGSVLMGCTRSKNGGISTTALYGITRQSVNNDWMKTASPDAWRSDFAYMDVKFYTGKAPANLSFAKSPPSINTGTAYGYNGKPNEITFSKSSGKLVSSTYSKWFGWVYESSEIQIPVGMSGGPLMNGSNQVIGINSNVGNGVSRFVKMQPRIVDSFYQ